MEKLMKPRVLIAGIVAVALATALGVSFAGDKEVVWTPQQVSAVAVWGHTSTSSVSFVSDKNLNKLEVRVDPRLQQFLSVAPSSVGKVSKGQTVALTLTLSAPPGTPLQVLTGTIELTKDRKKVYDALPVTLSIEPVVLPPDPGEAGKATLEGIDSDSDGLRDDVQRYIALTHPNEPVTRAALRQSAIPTLQGLVDAADKQASVAHAREEGRAENCLAYLLDIEGGYQADVALRAQILNTEERSIAYMKYDRQLGGQVFPGTPPEDWHLECDSPGGVQ